MARSARSLEELPLRPVEEGDYRLVIETPKGCRNKYTYDADSGLFLMSGVLSVGASFPFDFGFIPSTLGGDGDPLDVLLFMYEPAYPGVLVDIRLVGAIEANQTERDGTVEKNDRLIAVAEKSRTHAAITALSDLPEGIVDEIEHFFIAYNSIKGKKFELTGRAGARRAHELVKAAHRRYNAKRKKKQTRAR